MSDQHNSDNSKDANRSADLDALRARSSQRNAAAQEWAQERAITTAPDSTKRRAGKVAAALIDRQKNRRLANAVDKASTKRRAKNVPGGAPGAPSQDPPSPSDQTAPVKVPNPLPSLAQRRATLSPSLVAKFSQPIVPTNTTDTTDHANDDADT